MASQTATEVQRVLYRRRWWRLLLALLLLLVFLIGLVAIVAGGIALWRFTRAGTPHYADDAEHFKYGSIGSEITNGLPYGVWQALPALFPEAFDGGGYEAFGFLYETDADGTRHDLPIGLSRRQVSGVDVVWLNCAICHTGTVRDAPDAPARIVPGMPSNNLDLHRFVQFVLGIADSPKLEADTLIPAVEQAGAGLDWMDELTWRLIVVPRVREGLLLRRVKLGPLLAAQPAWGPGRVDTFNPYKMIQFDVPFDALSEAERIGAADFPAIFNQGPREGMNLHWDGNNDKLQERNLSAALGAGVTETTVDFAAIERVAEWLKTLPPPPSPYPPDHARVEAGKALYMTHCAACHGYQDGAQYVFEGERLGTVESNAALGVDPARLDSYTDALREHQLTLFAAYPKYRFERFKKTNGYANLPLDGLWLRAPYLHNGAVPTLADLLLPATSRPKTFVRGLDVLDGEKGGFQAPACTPGQPLEKGFCFDTGQTGNGNGGHDYGTTLGEEERAALLAYLLTF